MLTQRGGNRERHDALLRDWSRQRQASEGLFVLPVGQSVIAEKMDPCFVRTLKG